MQAPSQRHACALHTVSLQHSPAARVHARTRQAAAGRVPAAGSGRDAACRQAWTHAGWRTPQRPPQGARSGARRGAGLSQRHRALAGIWPCEIPISPIGLSQFWAGVHKPYCLRFSLNVETAGGAGKSRGKRTEQQPRITSHALPLFLSL